MKSRRLVYRVILKILALCGLVVLLWVLFNSLFTVDKSTPINTNNTFLVELSLSGMQRNEIRKAHLGNKEVAVLYRNNSDAYQNSTYPQFLKSNSRSLNKDYFVYYNYGDSLNCPLFYANDTFKDVCSGTQFDNTGSEKINKSHGFKVDIPPHYFSKNQLYFGLWEK